MENREHRDIFISYRNDGSGNQFAHRLVADLKQVGYSVYFNPDAHHAPDFSERLWAAIGQCKDFLLILSRGCLEGLMNPKPAGEKDWVREEILMARQMDKHIIPILMEGVVLPGSHEMPEELEFLPMIDMIRFTEMYIESPFVKLLQAINARRDGLSPYRDAFNGNPAFDVDADFSRTLEAARSGDAKAMYEAGMLYYYGVTTVEGKTSRRDYAEAYRWLHKAAETETEWRSHALSTIARMYYAGSVPGEAQSFQRAYEYHQMAAEGDDYSKSDLAYMKRVGLGCEFDFDGIISYYNEIIGSDDDYAISALAEFFIHHGMYQEAMNTFRRMSYISPKADYQMGMLYKQGVLSNPPRPDYIYAGYHLQKAAENHHLMAAYEYGVLCYRPTGDFRQDFPSAQKYFTIAADGGIADAQYMLGFMYEKGMVEKSMEKAIHYYDLAMQQGNSLAAMELSKCYQEPEFQNYQRAYECAKLAASHGVGEAELILGNLLLWGRGCEPDVHRAIEMYQRAQQHGMVYASVMLEKVRRMVE